MTAANSNVSFMYAATSNSYLSTEVAEDDQDDIPQWYSDNTHPNQNQPTLGAQLSPLQQETLLRIYPEVVQDKPGCTDWTVHSISTGDKGPVHLPPHTDCLMFTENPSRWRLMIC